MYSVNDIRFFTVCVSTFRNPRIEAYLQLPVAYRSLSRLSSAPDAKAFSLCSCLLELLLTMCLHTWSSVLSSRIAESLKKQLCFLGLFYSRHFSQLLVRLKLFFYPINLNFTWKDHFDFKILSFSLLTNFSVT